MVTPEEDVAIISSGSLPIWPDDFLFSNAGQPAGYSCVQIYEPDDLGDGWGDNFYCWRSDRVNPQLHWTWTGILLIVTVFSKTWKFCNNFYHSNR